MRRFQASRLCQKCFVSSKSYARQCLSASASLSSLVTIMPPSPVVMILLA